MRLYHAAPLHYLPHILESGALYAKSILVGQGIKPRRSAVRRDTMLGLTDWVHLSTRSDTPLLRDKLARGYPHVLLAFDREAVLALPEVALLPYNTKAWQTRSAYVPITDAAEKEALLRRHDEEHRFSSLEVLVHYGLDFAHLTKITFAADDECQWATELLAVLKLEVAVPPTVDPALAVLYVPTETRLLTHSYLAACGAARRVLPPPDIAFD